MTTDKSRDGADSSEVTYKARYETRGGDAARIAEVEAESTIWAMQWRLGGVLHRFGATRGRYRYSRSDLAGLMELEPTGFEPRPEALRIGTMEVMGELVALVFERAHAAHQKHLLATADAFREANLALEKDGAPPVHDVPALVGVLVRVLRERREYADSYASVKRDLDRESREARIAHDEIRSALDAIGEREPMWVAPVAAQVLRRMHSELAALRARDKDEDPGRKELNTALHEAGEPAGGMMLATAATVIRGLLAEKRPRGVSKFHVREGDRQELRALEGVAALDALDRVCRLYNDEERAGEAEKTLADLEAALEEIVQPLARHGESYLTTVHRVFGEVELVTKDAQEIVEALYPENQAAESTLDTVKRLVAERSGVSAGPAATLAAYEQQLEDAVVPARETGETVLGCVQRLVAAAEEVAQEQRRKAELRRLGIASETAESRERKRTLAAVALCHATLADAMKRLNGVSDHPEPLAIRGLVRAALKTLESIPFTPHVNGPEGGEVPSVAVSEDMERLHRVEAVASELVRQVDAKEQFASREVTLLRDALRHGDTPPAPAPSEPTFTWEPLLGNERRCIATFAGITVKGFARLADSGGTWSGYGGVGAPLYADRGEALTESVVQAWVENRLREQLARLVLEKSAPLGARKEPAVDLIVTLNREDVAKSILSNAPTGSSR